MSNKDDYFTKMENITLFLKDRGFVFPGSEIYNGLANSWDYGPLGAILKNKIKKLWWRYFFKNSTYNQLLDSSIFLNSKVWTASGHVDNFNDPLVDCKECNLRFRIDHLVEHYFPKINCEHWTNEQFDDFLITNQTKIRCLNCHKSNFSKVRKFQLMFETKYGATSETVNRLYLRPETAQGIFINFNNIVKAYNKKLPFGIGQVGKSFRNEITTGNYIFRTFEFEQMEIEFFFSPEDKTDWFNYWVNEVNKFVQEIGIKNANYRLYHHAKEQLSHYSLATIDIQYHFPFGWKELCGIANRGSYDLKQHSKFSNKKLMIKDALSDNKLIFPHVIEPSLGLERLFLAIICDNLRFEKHETKSRIVLGLNYHLAPYHVVVTSLNKNKLGRQAQEVFNLLKLTELDIIYDERTNIGKVYNYHDSIGTLYCVTIDYQTIVDNKVTVRDRDSMAQTRIAISDLKSFFYQKLNFYL